MDRTIKLTPAYKRASHTRNNHWINDPMDFPLGKQYETWMLYQGRRLE
jgi:hypothetical protein